MSIQTQGEMTLPRRQRLAVWAGLVGVTVLAWVYLIWMAWAMDMPMDDAMAGVRPWTAMDFVMMFLMWAIMMVGMMVPSAIPMDAYLRRHRPAIPRAGASTWRRTAMFRQRLLIDMDRV